MPTGTVPNASLTVANLYLAYGQGNGDYRTSLQDDLLFDFLSDTEVARMEEAIRSAYGDGAGKEP